MTFSINPTANKTQAMFQSMAIAQNGTGTTAPIAGGSAAPATATTASVAASATAAAASSTASMVTGQGTTAAGGACTCQVLCGVAAFPNPAVQGVAAFGGMSGQQTHSLHTELQSNLFNNRCYAILCSRGINEDTQVVSFLVWLQILLYVCRETRLGCIDRCRP